MSEPAINIFYTFIHCHPWADRLVPMADSTAIHSSASPLGEPGPTPRKSGEERRETPTFQSECDTGRNEQCSHGKTRLQLFLKKHALESGEEPATKSEPPLFTAEDLATDLFQKIEIFNSILDPRRGSDDFDTGISVEGYSYDAFVDAYRADPAKLFKQLKETAVTQAASAMQLDELHRLYKAQVASTHKHELAVQELQSTVNSLQKEALELYRAKNQLGGAAIPLSAAEMRNKEHEASGRALLEKVKPYSEYRNYIWHQQIDRDKRLTLFVTSNELLLVEPYRTTGILGHFLGRKEKEYVITVWKVPFWRIQTITRKKGSISISLRGGGQGPEIPITDEGEEAVLWKKIAGASEQINLKRTLLRHTV